MSANPDVLDKAADYIQLHGLNQNGSYFDEDKACILGACGIAAGQLNQFEGAFGTSHRQPTVSLVDTYAPLISRFVGLPSDHEVMDLGPFDSEEPQSVPDWNDHFADQDTVINTLRQLAQQLRGTREEHDHI